MGDYSQIGTRVSSSNEKKTILDKEYVTFVMHCKMLEYQNQRTPLEIIDFVSLPKNDYWIQESKKKEKMLERAFVGLCKCSIFKTSLRVTRQSIKFEGNKVQRGAKHYRGFLPQNSSLITTISHLNIKNLKTRVY